MPPDLVRTLRTVRETILRLWDADEVGGETYPGLIERIPVVLGIGRGEHEGTQFALEILDSVTDEEAEDRRWYVVLSTLHEELIFWFAPDVEWTATPVSFLWGPGEWDDLRRAAADKKDDWHSDAVQALDRTFFVRVVDSSVDLPRSAPQALALPATVGGRWFAVRADAPGDARNHVVGIAAGRCDPRRCDCAATTMAADLDQAGIAALTASR